MKKVIVSTFALAMLGSSAAFADADKLSAFQGIETAAVSATELTQVSGEGLLSNLLGAALGGNLLGGVLNGALVDSLLTTALGTVSGLGLLEGTNVNANVSVSTGALVGGVTGIQGAAALLVIQ